MSGTLLSSVLAIGWEPELRGLLTVILGLVAFMGSIYLILGTNIGARLGFLVTLTGLAGWMALMGAIWWIYGIGLKGEDPSWRQVPGRTVIQDTDALHQAGVFENQVGFDTDGPSVAVAEDVRQQFVDEGWRVVADTEPAFGQAESSATVFLEEEGAFAPGEFDVTHVYETGGEAYPKLFGLDSLDQIAFLHTPYYTVVEVAPYLPLREEPGRAPTAPEIDESRDRQYVYMIRDLGSRREPAAMITIGSTIVFLALAWMLHRRDRIVAENLSRKAELEAGDRPKADVTA
ncbi:MAG: hypothetical protein RIR49_2123 [Actinomycetota bacterium]|jgi:hypothetical protein